MIKKINLLFLLTVIAFTLFNTSCKTGKTSGPSYVGKWQYVVPDMPDDNTGVLVISKDGDSYNCIAITDGGTEQPMESFDILDGKIIASYSDGMGTKVEVGGTIEDNKIIGIISAQGMTLDWSATKVE